MSIFLSDFAQRESFIHRTDPRIRLITSILFSILFALSQNLWVNITALLLSAVIFHASKLTLIDIKGRLTAVNLFALTLFITIPLTIKCESPLNIAISYNKDSLPLCVQATLRCNAILLLITALVNTIEIVNLGHALTHLYVPKKLSHMFLFTIRYIDVIHQEYLQLKNAMIIRGFKFKISWHTYKSVANLVAMLIIRSLDRSEKINDAMKCRCFKGNFFLIHHFHLHRGDILFSVCAVILFIALLTTEVL